MVSSLFFAFAILNGALLLGTLYRRNYNPADEDLDYTWLGGDFPFEMPTGPIPTVEMTFHESIRFDIAYNSSIPNWETLHSDTYGIGYTHLGPFHHRYTSSAHHSLHCLHTFTTQFHRHDPQRVAHWEHCLMYLRQIFMCDVDMTLKVGDFLVKNFTLDRAGVTRKCRDWTAVDAWMKTKFREWEEFNGIVPD